MQLVVALIAGKIKRGVNFSGELIPVTASEVKSTCLSRQIYDLDKN